MPQLTVTNIVDGVGSLADKINAIIQDLKDAYNKLDTTNFNSSSNIPNSALARPKSYFYLQHSDTAVAAGTLITVVLDEFHLSTDCELVAVQFVAATVVAGDVEVDVYLTRGDPSAPDIEESVLAAQVTLAVSAVPVKGSGVVSRTSFLEGDLLSLRAVTGAGESITLLNSTLLFKKNHAT